MSYMPAVYIRVITTDICTLSCDENGLKNSKVPLTFCRNTLAYLGTGRLAEDRTSHMDLEWFSPPLRCPQLGNCLCIQALKGNESETLSSPLLYLSQLSIG